ncbi:hypothetical protein IAG25_32880 [Caballeronia sp. EK]|uniref:hypothetical protein n=1 Tax=Caballeronia sp. EK TaxID=2767469 RepID=UPI001654F394|nr:hypothetical protein [Caballeronia sp. EK]MBC8641621.1 hypothetical protein [Caballeronia sp. EK]
MYQNNIGDRMKIKYAAVLALLFSMASPAISAGHQQDYDPAEGRCNFWDDASLKTLTATLDYADQVLPNIPPEEDRYLTAESTAAQKVYEEELKKNNWKAPAQSQGNTRYAALEARPLYTVWGVRNALAKAKLSIAAILDEGSGTGFVTYRKNPDAAKLDRALHAIYPLDAYALSMQALLTKQTYVPQSHKIMLTADQWSKLYGGTSTLTTNLGYYMSCKLAKVMGRQSF